NMTSFMQQCVFYDLLLGKYTATDLLNAPDIWSFVTENASPARAFKYITGGGVENNSTIYTCEEGVKYLNKDWDSEINQAATVYGQRFFNTDNVNAKSELLSRLPIAMSYLTNISQDATQIMQQSMTANAIQQSLLNNGTEEGASAAVTQYASTRAEQLQISKFAITGDLAAHWLSIMQNVIEALLYGSFIIVALTMLMPAGFRVVKSYLEMIIWVQLWAPLYAILNLVMTMGSRIEFLSAFATTAGAGE
ncbi:MAG: conjugal transfer protein TraG N-terminal domain-containing protein, partial [Gammaproteobacteria bacterium]